MRIKTANILFMLIFLAACFNKTAAAQDQRKIELNAQAILARVDRLLDYPHGELRGSLKLTKTTGETTPINVRGCISKGDSLFIFNRRDRGDLEKVLLKRYGEDIWVYKTNSLKLFSITGDNKFKQVLTTDFSYLDISHADLQNNYNASIEGSSRLDNRDVYKLQLKPIYRSGNYSRLVIYVAKKNYYPLRIEFYDHDDFKYKFMNISRVKKFGNKLFPTRYEIINTRSRTITMLNFFRCDSSYRFDRSIFRSENLKK